MMKNNKGISLIEVIVVIAMLAILLGGGIYGIGQISGFRAREAADKIASSITKNKVDTLGKAKESGGMAWELYREGNNYYVRTVYDVGTSESYSEAEKINDGTISVSYGSKIGGAVSWQDLADGGSVRIYFNRSTGALCGSDGSSVTDNMVVRAKSGNKDYEVEVIAKTGKIISQTIKK